MRRWIAPLALLMLFGCTGSGPPLTVDLGGKKVEFPNSRLYMFTHNAGTDVALKAGDVEGRTGNWFVLSLGTLMSERDWLGKPFSINMELLGPDLWDPRNGFHLAEGTEYSVATVVIQVDKVDEEKATGSFQGTVLDPEGNPVEVQATFETKVAR